MRKIRDLDKINDQATTEEENFIYVVRDFLEKLETVEISKLARKRIKEILKGSELEGSEYLS